MKKGILIILLTTLFGSAFAQVKYWVFFTDKPLAQQQMVNPQNYLSEQALQRRSIQEINVHESDMPVHKPYIEELEQQGVFVLRESK